MLPRAKNDIKEIADEENKLINVYRVLHGKRDILSILKQEQVIKK
jgi:plasmid stabilization system protein ParE